jgi:hypothetical protein
MKVNMFLSMVILTVVSTQGPKKLEAPAFLFEGDAYFLRLTRSDLREYASKTETDLSKFTDLVTINDYPTVKDGDSLAKTANAVLETYKQNKAFVVKTSSVPRTKVKPAEHLVVVLFQRDNFLEASFARFVLVKSKGKSIVYSHRIYGTDPTKAMGSWIKEHGEKREKSLMVLLIPIR